MKDKALRILSPTWRVAWALTLLALPVTSFPFLSRVAGGTQVAPLSVIPLGFLCLTFLPVYIFSRGRAASESRPLIVFTILALIASVAALFLDIPTYKGFTPLKNSLEAFITLGMGLAFYFTMLGSAISSKELNFALRFITLGGMILLLWSVIQLIASWFSGGDFPKWMVTIQSFFSITGIQNVTTRFRVSGTTLEPSWLAHCLNILYIPLWLGCTAARYSAFRFRIFKLSLENLLLIIGVIILVFTYSRIGLLAFTLVILWYLIHAGRSLGARLSARFLPGKPRAGAALRILLAVFLGSILILGMGGIALRLSQEDPRFESFFSAGTSEYLASGGRFLNFANRLNIAERAVLWDLGWKVFEKHPILGVGLGNAGMFTMSELSSYAWKLPELTRVLYVDSSLPNTKNLWVRLLAETGLVGFSLFLTWLLVLWLAARRLQGQSTPLFSALGWCGQFTLVALLLEGFSIDTFALPYLWISLGLITAASFLRRSPPASAEAFPPR